MSSKWSYTDFLMYVIPGSYALTMMYFALLSLFCGAKAGFSISPIIASVFLLFLVFVLGNLVQALSHKKAEKKLKEEYWKGYYPTQLLLLKDNDLLSEQARASFISSTVKLKVLPEEEALSFNKAFGDFDSGSSELKALMRRSRELGDNARVLLQIKGHADRLKGTEAYYLMFRGLFFSNFWLGVLLVAVIAANIARHFLAPHVSWLVKPDSELLAFGIPAALAGVCFFLWRVFRDRCRGAGYGLARELVRAVAAEVALVEAATPEGTPPDSEGLPSGISPSAGKES